MNIAKMMKQAQQMQAQMQQVQAELAKRTYEATAVREASTKAKADAQKEMGKLTAGLGLPGF